MEFLQREAADPQDLMLKALETHRVVIMGEVHHRPRYWAFDAALARATNFSQKVGVIYLELPNNDQPLVDQFLAAPRYDSEPVIEMLRDDLWTGWPDQPMLDFFKRFGGSISSFQRNSGCASSSWTWRVHGRRSKLAMTGGSTRWTATSSWLRVSHATCKSMPGIRAMRDLWLVICTR